MLERILIPTDGSALSELALGVAETLARAQGAELILARVVEPPRWVETDSHDWVMPDLYSQLEEALKSEAQAGLDQLAEQLRRRGLTPRPILLHGFAASELLDCEQRERPDLVIMATHGRTGVARFALGSVADRLVREGISPVLVVRSFSPGVSWTERALVPLDGSALAEQALPMVETLAGKPLKWVKLLRAVASSSEVAAATAYLAPVAVRLANAGLEVIPEVRIDSPAEAIQAEGQAVDLVILATHGRGGFDRFQHGSVAEETMRHLAAPLLLVRAPETAQPDAPSSSVATAGPP